MKRNTTGALAIAWLAVTFAPVRAGIDIWQAETNLSLSSSLKVHSGGCSPGFRLG